MASISTNRPSLMRQYLKLDVASINDFSFTEGSGDTAGSDILLAVNDITNNSPKKLALYCESSTGVLLKIAFDSGDFDLDPGVLILVPAGEGASFNYEGEPFETIHITYLSDFEASPSIETLSIIVN